MVAFLVVVVVVVVNYHRQIVLPMLLMTVLSLLRSGHCYFLNAQQNPSGRRTVHSSNPSSGRDLHPSNQSFEMHPVEHRTHSNSYPSSTNSRSIASPGTASMLHHPRTSYNLPTNNILTMMTMTKQRYWTLSLRRRMASAAPIQPLMTVWHVVTTPFWLRAVVCWMHSSTPFSLLKFVYHIHKKNPSLSVPN